MFEGDPGETDAPRRRHAAFAFLGAFAVLLLGQGAVRELRSPTDARGIADAYAELVSALPDDAVELGYLSNETSGDLGAQLLYETQYALAPRVVAANPRARFTVAHLTDPGRLPELCARAGLRPVKVLASGLALLELDPAPERPK